MSMPTLYQIDKVRSRKLFTILDIYQKGERGHHAAMTEPMTNEEVRRENARWLAQKCGGPTAFAEITDMAPPRVTHIIGPNPSRKIGHAVARRIEKAFNKPIGWLDIPNAWRSDGDNGEEGGRSGYVNASDIMASDIMEFIDTYHKVSNKLREDLMDSVRVIRSRGVADRGAGGATARNES